MHTHLIVLLFYRCGKQAPDSNPVATHNRSNSISLGVKEPEIERLAKASSELEHMAHFYSGNRLQCAVTSATGLA